LLASSSNFCASGPLSSSAPASNAPQRDKQPGALWQPVIARSWLEATGTLRRDAAVRLDFNFDMAGPPVSMAVEANVLENKTGEMLNGVQKRLNL